MQRCRSARFPACPARLHPGHSPAPTGPAPARRRRLHARALRLRCKRGRRESEGRAEPRALARRDGPFLSHSGKRGSPSRAVDEAPRRGFPAVPLAVPVDLCLTGSSSRLALNCLERLTFACSVYHGITFEQHLAQGHLYAAWNSDVMPGVLAAILDHEDSGSRDGGTKSWKIPNLITFVRLFYHHPSPTTPSLPGPSRTAQGSPCFCACLPWAILHTAARRSFQKVYTPREDEDVSHWVSCRTLSA
ncbi:uncharacterized protein [Equus przewalskii]|uniref:Uncharacterized protein n=1 Tax=Equus przewalskii TaxID=9798 RepID=A0ABM4QHJ1_EQUPR